MHKPGLNHFLTVSPSHLPIFSSSSFAFFNTCAFRPITTNLFFPNLFADGCTPYIHLPGVPLLRRSTPGYQHISPPGKDSSRFNTVVKNSKLLETHLIFTSSHSLIFPFSHFRIFIDPVSLFSKLVPSVRIDPRLSFQKFFADGLFRLPPDPPVETGGYSIGHPSRV